MGWGWQVTWRPAWNLHREPEARNQGDYVSSEPWTFLFLTPLWSTPWRPILLWLHEPHPPMGTLHVHPKPKDMVMKMGQVEDEEPLHLNEKPTLAQWVWDTHIWLSTHALMPHFQFLMQKICLGSSLIDLCKWTYPSQFNCHTICISGKTPHEKNNFECTVSHIKFLNSLHSATLYPSHTYFSWWSSSTLIQQMKNH